jgi:hypothetical protein
LCEGIKTRKIVSVVHTFQSWGEGFCWETSGTVQNTIELGSNLTHSLYLKHDLTCPAISNQGLEDIFPGEWPLNKLWGFPLLDSGEKSQGMEAEGGIFLEHQKPFDPGLWWKLLKNAVWIAVPWVLRRLMGEDCLSWCKTQWLLNPTEALEKEVQSKIHTFNRWTPY